MSGPLLEQQSSLKEHAAGRVATDFGSDNPQEDGESQSYWDQQHQRMLNIMRVTENSPESRMHTSDEIVKYSRSLNDKRKTKEHERKVEEDGAKAAASHSDAVLNFVEANSNAGRSVAMAGSRARVLAEPEMVSDMAKSRAGEATATKLRKVDEDGRRTWQIASFLRQPGRCTAAEVKEDDRMRFIEPLDGKMYKTMMGRRVGQLQDTQANRDLQAALDAMPAGSSHPEASFLRQPGRCTAEEAKAKAIGDEAPITLVNNGLPKSQAGGGQCLCEMGSARCTLPRASGQDPNEPSLYCSRCSPVICQCACWRCDPHLSDSTTNSDNESGGPVANQEECPAMVAELADHGWLRALDALGVKYAEGKEGESRVCKLTCAAAFSRLAKLTTHSEKRLLPMSAPHLIHFSASCQRFSTPEQSFTGDWKYAKVIGDEASITSEREQLEGVNHEQQKGVEDRLPVLSRLASLTTHSEKRLLPMSALQLIHFSAPCQHFSAPEHVFNGDWKYAKAIGDKASTTLEHEQLEGVNHEQREGVEDRLPCMPRKPEPRCQVCMEIEYRPLVVCELPRGCGRRAHAFRCAIIINEEGVHSWRCRICRPRPYADVPLVPQDAVAVQAAVDIEDAAIKQLDDLAHKDRVRAARLLSRQAAANRMQGEASRSSGESEEEDEGSPSDTSEPAAGTGGTGNEESERFRDDVQRFMNKRLIVTTTSQGISNDAAWLQAMQEHGQAVVDQVASHHNDQGESTFHGSHLGSECRSTKRQADLEEGDPLDPSSLDRRRYRVDFHTVNVRSKVMTTVTMRNVMTTVTTTAKQGISDKQCKNTQCKQCNADWLQVTREHVQAVADQVASHHDVQGQSTFHGSNLVSERRIAKRQAALEEGDPREKPAQKKVKGEAPAEQRVEKPGEVELCQCSPMLLLSQCSLRCQCSQTIRLIVLQEREDFPGRWKPGWCHHCLKPAPWMTMQPLLSRMTQVERQNL